MKGIKMIKNKLTEILNICLDIEKEFNKVEKCILENKPLTIKELEYIIKGKAFININKVIKLLTWVIDGIGNNPIKKLIIGEK